MNKIKCWFGFHSPKEIGRAIHPYKPNKTILGMGCRYCGKKLKKGYLVDTDLLENPLNKKPIITPIKNQFGELNKEKLNE